MSRFPLSAWLFEGDLPHAHLYIPLYRVLPPKDVIAAV